MIEYKEIQNGYNPDSEFDTWILAFCPDSDSWFATNHRFFFYEYPMDFPNEEAAIGYFKRHPDVFITLEKDMNIHRPYFNEGGVWLENTNELVKIKS